MNFTVAPADRFDVLDLVHNSVKSCSGGEAEFGAGGAPRCSLPLSLAWTHP